jgi:meromycolic acid enoyl-[acyl-carrier-protein] reductase
VGILDDKHLLITGVLTDDSLAFGVARKAQEEGADIVLTGFGRALSLTQRTARKLDPVPEVLELDIANTDHAAAVTEHLRQKWGRVDGALHSIGFAPAACLGDDFFGATWDDVSVAVQVSAYSLRSLADIVRPLMTDGGSLVGLTFDATVAWPAYNWMGMAKAAMESLNRYLARELGKEQIRCNLVAAGPMRTIAAKSIPGFAAFEEEWVKRAPLGWDVNDSTGVAKACAALLSDWFPHTTGQIIHVDGGYSIIGA